MTSDMMIICKEDESSALEKGYANALFIDECSMGAPLTEFGEWFQGRYCGAPSIIEQIGGIKEHTWVKLTPSDLVGIMHAAENMKTHENLVIKNLNEYIHNHNGKNISTENW